MFKKNGIDDLLDFLVTGPGFKAINIRPLPDAELAGNQNRFSVEVHNGPLSDFKSYKGESVTQALQCFLKDLVDCTSVEINHREEELKILKNISL